METSLAQGRLRRDLFYRLSSVTLRLPPLRDRQSDIPILVDYYIKQFSKSWLIEPPHLSASVLGALCNHDWPGNIRELRNVVSRLLLHSLDGAVTEALVRKRCMNGTTFPVRRQNPRSSSRYPHQPKFHYRRLPGEMAPICQALRKMNVPIFWRHYASLGASVWPAWCCGPAEGATVHAATQNTQAGIVCIAPPDIRRLKRFALSVQQGEQPGSFMGISPATSGRPCEETERNTACNT